MLGDVRIPGYEPPDDSFFSLDYFREKALDYQNTLNCLDLAVNAAYELLAIGIDEQTDSEIRAQLDEINSKRFQMKYTTEAINAAAAVVNAAGGRFPVLSLPPTLGIAPIVLPAAGIAAIAVAATLIAWGVPMIQTLATIMRRAQVLESITNPDDRAAAAIRMDAAQTSAEQAASQSIGGGLGEIGTAIKWLAIAALGFIAWREFGGSSQRRLR